MAQGDLVQRMLGAATLNVDTFEEVEADDLLLTGDAVYNSPKLDLKIPGDKGRILGVDVARFGEDETVFSIVENKNIIKWDQIYQDTWRNKGLMEVVGRIVDIVKEWRMPS